MKNACLRQLIKHIYQTEQLERIDANIKNDNNALQHEYQLLSRLDKLVKVVVAWCWSAPASICLVDDQIGISIDGAQVVQLVAFSHLKPHSFALHVGRFVQNVLGLFQVLRYLVVHEYEYQAQEKEDEKCDHQNVVDVPVGKLFVKVHLTFVVYALVVFVV